MASKRKNANEKAQPTPLTAEELLSVDIEKPIRESDVVDAHVLGNLYENVFKDLADQSSVEARVYALLRAVCSFHFKPEDSSSPFGPMWEMDGKRSSIPEDFAGPQALAFATIAEKIEHLGLRARIADTAWLNNKRDARVGTIAVEAYSLCVRQLLSGDFRARFARDESTPFEALKLAERAVQIAVALKRRADPLAGIAAETLVDLGKTARATGDLSLYRRASALAWNHGLLDSRAFATELESHLADEPDPMGRKRIWEQAAACYRDIGEEDHVLRCQIAAAEELVAMADAMGSPLASASWLADAIKSLRPLKGTKPRRKELELRLREAQENLSDEMTTFSSGPIDLADIAQGTIEVFEPMSLPTALGQLAILTRSPALEDRRTEALNSLKESSLASLFEMTKVDRDGKTIAVVPAANLRGEPNEDWMLHKYAESDSLRRRIFVAGQLEPVRQHLASRVSFTDRYFKAIVQNSPFVPLGYESIFARGFARMMQGDFLSAAYLLLPQMENSIRDVLAKAGHDPSIIQSDMSQEDRSLSSMLENNRAELDEIFGPDLTLEIDLLFNSRLGPALRHDMAHGKVNTNECHDADVRYACWLIYRVTCLPLLAHWSEIVAQIEASEF